MVIVQQSAGGGDTIQFSGVPAQYPAGTETRMTPTPIIGTIPRTFTNLVQYDTSTGVAVEH